jgi:ribosomal protein S5
MNGKAISPKEPRDGYILVSYGTAKETAIALDKALQKVNYCTPTDIPSLISHRIHGTATSSRITLYNRNFITP